MKIGKITNVRVHVRVHELREQLYFSLLSATFLTDWSCWKWLKMCWSSESTLSQLRDKSFQYCWWGVLKLIQWSSVINVSIVLNECLMTLNNWRKRHDCKSSTLLIIIIVAKFIAALSANHMLLYVWINNVNAISYHIPNWIHCRRSFVSFIGVVISS